LGESLAAVALVEEIRKQFPNIQFSFSTTTRTGRVVLEKLRKEDEVLFYFPLDLSWVVRRVVQKLDPDIFATLETEIWPNLILALKEKNIPILLLNGRISKKSFRRYRWVRWAIRDALKEIELFCMQYPEDGERILKLGGRPEKIHIVGNMKFDLSLSPEGVSSHEVRRRLGLEAEETLWVAGSTHPGEERSLLEIYQVLSRNHPNLRLLIAPRHPERTKEVVKLIGTFHRPATLFSENGSRKEDAVFVLDTVGQLRSLYAASDLVFIGGSLVPKGGQNLLEPAFFAKPILFGPHMDNFQDIVQLFLEGKAAVQVRSQEELASAARLLLKDASLRRSLGEKAKQIVLAHRGVVDRHLELLKAFLAR